MNSRIMEARHLHGMRFSEPWRVAVVSVGEGNQFGHPVDTVAER